MSEAMSVYLTTISSDLFLVRGSISQGTPEKQNQEDIFRGIFSYVVGAGKSEACGAGWEVGNSQAGTKVAVLRGNFFFLRETSVLLFRPVR